MECAFVGPEYRNVKRTRAPRRAAVVLLLGVVVACGGDAGGKPETKRAVRRVPDSSGGALDFGGNGYRVVPLTNPGAVIGTVRIEGSPPVPKDTVVIAASERSVCRTASADPLVSAKGGLGNAVVWIADAESGKALPGDKRLDLASEECRLDPRVQGAVVGSTFNVFNDDRLIHRLVFLRFGTHDTLTVMPFFNTGQLVPSERLAKSPGLVEVRCAQHSWTHGFIAVFDHPYFAVTKPDGSFRIDSVPAGKYRMMIWHEGAAQPIERAVTVASGADATLDVAIALTR
jgi:hypothetical protein